jgi:hypothetical protein
MFKKIVATFVLVIFAGTILPATPAFADDSNRIIQIIQNLAPGLLEQTVNDGELSFSDSKAITDSGVIKLLSKSLEKQTDLSLVVNYARSLRNIGKGLTLLTGKDSKVYGLGQETGNGFRVLTAITGIPSANRFDYAFEVPNQSEVRETSTGYLLVSGGKVLGSLDKPWAIDANGNQLATHFEWKYQVLTQVLDEDLAKVNYPVLMDPAWGYVYQYDLTFSAATNMNRIKTCFNCYFPVSGAPKAYPKQGQLLPLTVALFNFECTMGPTVQSANYASFEFYATRNHVDGYGSNIIFQFLQIGSKNYLVVDAYIVNSLDFIRGPYMAGAGLNWQIFAWNLNSPTPRS